MSAVCGRRLRAKVSTLAEPYRRARLPAFVERQRDASSSSIATARTLPKPAKAPYTDGDNGELEPCKNLDDAITQPAGANDFAPEVRVAEDATRKLKNVPQAISQNRLSDLVRQSSDFNYI
jgi:hypothetical protein